MKYIGIIGFIFFNLNICYSEYINTNIGLLTLPQGFVLNSLNGFGFSNNVLPQISNISSGNPASASNFQNFSLALSYQLNSKIDQAWPYPFEGGIGLKQNNLKIPQSLVVLLPYKNIRLGLSTHQVYNYELEYPQQETMFYNPEHPDGILKTYNDKENAFLTQTSIIFAQSFENIFLNNTHLSYGVQYNFDYLKYQYNFFLWEESRKLSGNSWKLGIRYDKVFSNDKNYKLGLYYEKGINIKKEMKYETQVITITPSNDTLYYRSFLIGKTPDKIDFGFLYKFSSNFTITGNSTYELWSNITDYKYLYIKKIKNQLNISSSLIFEPNNSFSTSLGFYKTNPKYLIDSESSYKPKLDFSATYISIGAVFKFNNFNINTAFADSHLFSDDSRKQSIIKLGIEYHL